MGKKGVHSQKGKGERWEEPKTAKVTLLLTPTGRKLAKERSQHLGVSLSEVLERWGREIAVGKDSAIQIPKEIIEFEDIKRTLGRLSRSQLNQLIKVIGDLLVNPEKQTIKQLIAANKQLILETYGEDVFTGERLDEIIGGDKPSLEEKTLLAAVLPLEEEEFDQMFSMEFPQNGNNHQECSSNSK